MRGKKTVINTIMGLFQEVISIISALILPRLILSFYGSKYNGLINSITQFLSCAVLLRSGIGGATRAALYKPLANKNQDEINSIIKATDIFMKKVGILLLVLILVAATIYPYIVKNEFEWMYTFSLFCIIGIGVFAESFFGITYLILLQADQKLWIASLMKTVCYIINIIVSSILICNNQSIHIVKLASAAIFVLYPIMQSIFVKKKYNINTNVKPDNSAISQRWDAFWHQVATFVTYNTDITILTLFTNMLEVSVYSVYALVVSGLKSVILSISNGLEAAFGNMIARQEDELLKENVSIIEFVIYSVSTVLFSSAIVLIIPFVRLYTQNITDVNYIRPVFAVIILVAQFFNCIRLPYQLVIQAAGHYKQTKNGAIIEVLLNILISILLVMKLGLIGVAIGTLISAIIRTIELSIYMSKTLVKRNWCIVIKRISDALLSGIFVILLFKILKIDASISYFLWFLESIFVVFCSSIVVGIVGIVNYTNDFKGVIKKIKIIFSKRRKVN